MKIGPNDKCPCGSGKKFKKCCYHCNIEDVISARRSTTVPLNQEDRLTILFAELFDIFGLKKGTHWDQVKKNISGDQVTKLYQVVASLWPPTTDYIALLPKPSDKLRALYLGEIEPEHLLSSVYRFGLYADEILIVDPFHNPWQIRSEYNPIENPNQFKSDTLKLLFFMTQIYPWVQGGIVKIIPNPGHFDFSLFKKTVGLAKNRFEDLKVTRDELDDGAEDARKSLRRFFLTLPVEYHVKQLKDYKPEMSEQEIAQVLDYIQDKIKEDPLVLDQPFDRIGEQLSILRLGGNLEMSLYLAHLAGAFPYTNVKLRWRELFSVMDQWTEDGKIWTPLTRAFQSLNFKFLNNVDPEFACAMRKDGRISSFRTFMKKIWQTVGKNPEPEKIEIACRDFRDELKDEYAKAEAEWNKIDRDFMLWAGTSITTTAVATGGALVTGSLGLGLAATFAIPAVLKLIATHGTRKDFRKTIPMSVFLDLNKKSKK